MLLSGRRNLSESFLGMHVCVYMYVIFIRSDRRASNNKHAVVVCLSVYLSKTAIVSKRLDRLRWFLARELLLIETVLSGNSGTSKSKGTSLGNFVPNSADITHFATASRRLWITPKTVDLFRICRTRCSYTVAQLLHYQPK